MRPPEAGSEVNEQTTNELPIFHMQPVCPSLGLRHDPASCALLPRADHICTLPQAPAPSLAWQARYCLGDYEACPMRHPGSRPVVTRRSHSHRLRLGLALVAVAVLGLTGVGIWNPGHVSLSFELSRDLPTVAPVRGISAEQQDGGEVQAATSPAPTPTSLSAVASTGGTTRLGDGYAPLPTATATPSPTPKPTTPVPNPTPTPALRQHVVEKGETLTEIAERYGTTVEAIVALNGIKDPNLIFAGTVLKIPPPAQRP